MKKINSKAQKEKTEVLRDMHREARQLDDNAPMNMRGKQFGFERMRLRELILKTYKSSEQDFYNESGRFIADWLCQRILADFYHGKIEGHYPTKSEKSIKVQIRKLVDLKKIPKNNRR